MSLLVEEFRKTVSQRRTALTQKHREERRLMKGLLIREGTKRAEAGKSSDLTIENFDGSIYKR